MPKRKEVDDWLAGYENPMKEVVVRIRQITPDAIAPEATARTTPRVDAASTVVSKRPV
jgi:hypothetical protein